MSSSMLSLSIVGFHIYFIFMFMYVFPAGTCVPGGSELPRG